MLRRHNDKRVLCVRCRSQVMIVSNKIGSYAKKRTLQKPPQDLKVEADTQNPERCMCLV